MANYLTNDEIYKEWKVWKETGVVTEEFGRQMKLMTDHILQHPNFNRYSIQDKEDIAMAMVEHMMRNLKNMHEKARRSFFNYLNACCFSAAYSWLRKHYSHVNRMRRLILQELEEWQTKQPTPQNADIIKQIKQNIAEFEKSYGKKEDKR